MEFLLEYFVSLDQRPNICVGSLLPEEAHHGQVFQAKEFLGLDVVNAKMPALGVRFADSSFPRPKVTNHWILVGVDELMGHVAHNPQILVTVVGIREGARFDYFSGL
jgi:hypothetical protein